MIKKQMLLNDYQTYSMRTMPKITVPFEKRLSNYALGLAGESGEVADIIKKHVYHEHPLDRENAKKELGDVFHYLAGICTILGFSLEEVAIANIEKLAKRYPDGFNSEASINRIE